MEASAALLVEAFLETIARDRRRCTPCNNVRAMATRSSTTPATQHGIKPKLKSGLPGTPEEQRRDLRAAMKKHAETLRRLAQ
jgi:hypothetical protein